jgi:hypothetical protein
VELEQEKLAAEQKDKDREWAAKVKSDSEAAGQEQDQDQLTGSRSGIHTSSKLIGPKLSYFEDGKDNMDAYLFRFEKSLQFNDGKRKTGQFFCRPY